MIDLFAHMLLDDPGEPDPQKRLTEAQLAQYFRHRNGTCPGCEICVPPSAVDPGEEIPTLRKDNPR